VKKKIIIAVVLFITALIVLFFYSCYRTKTRNSVETLVRNKKIINIFVTGSNVFRENSHRFFCIISINPDNANAGITFLPPAYRISLNDGGDRFTTLERAGLDDFDHIQRTIRADLKLAVPFYFELYSPDVVRTIDLLEGIDLFVMDQLKDPGSPDYGLHYFDGGKVVRYINSAEENSIYVKYDRVLDVLLTLYHDKNKLKRFDNAPFIIEMFKSIKTNLLPQEILSVAELVLKGNKLISTVLPGGFENGYYLVDDITRKIYEKEFLSSLVLDREIDPHMKIKVLNGTGTPGLARKMRNSLIRDGLTVTEFGTSKYQNIAASIIVNRRASQESLGKLSEITGISNIYHVIDSTQMNNVLIIIGEDYARK